MTAILKSGRRRYRPGCWHPIIVESRIVRFLLDAVCGITQQPQQQQQYHMIWKSQRNNSRFCLQSNRPSEGRNRRWNNNNYYLSTDVIRRAYYSTSSSSSSSRASSTRQGPSDIVFSHLQSPTDEDVQEFHRRMGNRPGSVLTESMTSTMAVETAPSISSSSSSSSSSSISSSSSLDKYNIDWTGQYKGHSTVVVRPESTEEVSRILSYCHERRLGVVPQGGNTGLVGGSIPIANEVILSLERMNTIYGFENNNIDDDCSKTTVSQHDHPPSKSDQQQRSTDVLRAEAGCVLQNLQEYASLAGSLIPVDLGAKGSCQIGGNLSTNAGGVYYYRYGSLHANVLGVEVVLPDGRILNLGYHPISHLKDNTGYDLKHLFIGSEGTLGVITKVALKCPPQPSAVGGVWLTCRSLQDVLTVLQLAKKKHLNEILAAFEFMDGPILQLVQRTRHRHSVTLPPIVKESLSHSHYNVLIETHGSNHGHDQEKLYAFIEHVMNENLVVDGMIAQSISELHEFWKIREACNPSAAATGYVYKYDVSLAPSDFDSFIHDIRGQLELFNGSTSKNICVNWGHIIDGNLHCNIVSPGVFEKDADFQRFIDNCIFEAVGRRHGSISAEHGLGQYKNKYLPLIKEAPVYGVMGAIKQLFDPHGIMNPGKYLA